MKKVFSIRWKGIFLLRKIMKKYLIILFAAALIWSCGSEKEDAGNPALDSLDAINKGLQNQIGEKDSSIIGFIAAINEIQDNLDVVKARQKLVKASSGSKEKVTNNKAEIIKDIQMINELMEDNKQKIVRLQERLKTSDSKTAELEKLITRLGSEIEEKNLEIQDLQNQLERSNLELGEMTRKFENADSDSKQKTALLNTAYYTAGTTKDLIKKGVITKSGGFIGIGKAKKLAENFNQENFVKVDITRFKSAKFEAKNIKLITTHPPNTFVITSSKEESVLTINKPDQFWSASKYLVVLLEK